MHNNLFHLNCVNTFCHLDVLDHKAGVRKGK